MTQPAPLDSLLEHELRYLARGLPIFPVCDLVPHTHPDEDGRPQACENLGKVPLVRWKQYQEHLPSETDVFGWRRRWPRHNIGMATGHLSGLVVMDLDGELAIRVAQARGFDNGPHVFTGRVGGVHRYFQWSPEAPRNFVKRDGIDFRGEGGYVILPPSHHALGRDYLWGEELGELDDLPALPEWMADLGHQRSQRTAEPSEEVIPEHTRNDRLTQLAGSMRHYGAAQASILAALLTINERQCQPPLSVGEVRQIAESVSRYAPEPDDSPRIRLQPEPKAAAALDFLTGISLEDIEEEDVHWFAYGLAAPGLLTELDGKVKQAGKTTLLLAAVNTILKGESFLGSPTNNTPVMYLSEQSVTSFRRNARRAGLLGRGDFHVLLWASTRGWRWPDLIQEVERRMLEVGAKLLIVDTLGQFSGIRGDDENKSGRAMEAMEPLQALITRGFSVIVSRHDRKSGGDVGDSGRGSSAYAGTADVVLHLYRPSEHKPGTERQRVLEGLSRFEETPEKLLIELVSQEPNLYSALGDVADVRDRKLRIEILSCLPTSKEDAIPEKELQELVEGRLIDCKRVLRHLLDTHEVLRTGAGKHGDPYLYWQKVWDPETGRPIDEK